MQSYFVAIDMLTNHLGLSVDEAIESINLPPDMEKKLKQFYLQYRKKQDEQQG
ncbi:hypothetical protein OLZ31_24325 [Enterobacter asburiae]|nr:hypothetical protein [Enterobacter asburiae]